MKPKVAIVDHSYHEKTKSTEFLFDLFRQYFEVEVFFDDCWKIRNERFSMGGMPVRGDYDWIVFLQVFPPPGIFKFLKCKNILCVPMLDGMIGVTPEFFSRFRSCYFLSFSQTLHDFLTHLGYRSFYLQYFPEVTSKDGVALDTIDDSENEAAFFWQRRTPVTSSVVKALLGEQSSISRLHIHRKADPGFEFLEDEEIDFPSGLEVTSSKWLETREEFHRLMSQSGVFFAPREYEGIGMSFLEAMGLGKCVIAPDRPTVNEYIDHGVNGLLYDPMNPEPLDLTSVPEIRRKAIHSSKEGRQEYLANADRLMRSLTTHELSLFGDFRLATNPDIAAARILRTNEYLELARQKGSSPWLIRTGKRFLLGIICLLGIVYTYLSGKKRRKTKA